MMAMTGVVAEYAEWLRQREQEASELARVMTGWWSRGDRQRYDAYSIAYSVALGEFEARFDVFDAETDDPALLHAEINRLRAIIASAQRDLHDVTATVANARETLMGEQ